MDSVASNDEASLQQILDENNAKLEKLRSSYEQSLNQYYLMKAQESIIELQFESWKKIYRKHETHLADKFNQIRDAKLQIWRDREAFCDYSNDFVKNFSLNCTLNKLQHAASANDTPKVKTPNKLDSDFDPAENLHLLQMAEIEEELAKLKQREAELDIAERELLPDEDTVRRLQETLNNSVSCLEETEAEIKAYENKEKDAESEVKSILKRPSFLAKEMERKKVRFE